MLKVVEIIPALHPIGGAQTFFANLCESFISLYDKEMDLTCIFLYKKQSNFIYDQIGKLKCKKIFLDKKKGIDLKCAKELKRILNEIKPDIINSHLDTTLTLFLAFKFLKKIPIVHTVHNMIGPEFKKSRFNNFLMKIGFLTPICVSENSAKSLEKYLHKEVKFINNGVIVSNYNSLANSEKRDIDFICVGSFTPVKNHCYLIECFNLIKDKNRLKMYLLGDGELRPQIENKIASLKLNKNIVCVGNVSNVSEYMSRSKILVMPSLSEGNPMVINEALASGVFVVANKVGGIPNLITDSSNGFLVQKGDSCEFSNKMIEALDYNFLDERRKSVKESAADISKTCSEYYNFFSKLIKEK